MVEKVNKLSVELTSYDFLKTFAIVTMVIDSLGAYIFPEVEELRAIGRMSLPIWMFLVGYSTTRELPNVLWIGGLILVLGDFVFGSGIFSLNILFSIIIVRFLIDHIMRIALKNHENFAFVMVALFFLWLPTFFIFEYGTLGILWAMTGYICRHQKEIGWSDKLVIGFFVLVSAIYCAYQILFYQFVIQDQMIMVACVATSAYFLFGFKPQTHPKWTQKFSPWGVKILQFTGRKTLHIYVAHILVFMAISFFLYPQQYELFDFRLY